jgi:L-lactate dehydrogenase complex protein LldG
MTTAGETFLERVRHAVAAHHAPGEAAPIPPRGKVGYAGAGEDPIATFAAAFAAAGGRSFRTADASGTATRVLELVQQSTAQKILLGRTPLLDGLALAEPLRSLGREVITLEDVEKERGRDAVFAAELSITGVDYLIAETGSMVVCTRAEQPRSLSLLPPTHIAVAERRQVLPDLFDLFDKLGPDAIASCVTLITGPSKTGDIELRLVTGVHGPGEVHVVLCEAD